MPDTRTAAERDVRRLMDEALARNEAARPHTSPWVRRAQRGALPYNVYASLRTDARVSVAREPLADVLRRTMPVRVEDRLDITREEHDRALDEVRERMSAPRAR